MNGHTIKVHRVVASTWIRNPLNKSTVNHINAVKDDNQISNLEWSTKEEQTAHAIANGLMKTLRGEAATQSILNDKLVRRIRQLKHDDPTLSSTKIAAMLPVKVTHYAVKDVLAGRSWKHVV
ncbi:HNH endonuclease [Pseudarthrobacter sp. ATCC 49987]|uniref:HNH endonuclease n=1 Tax=Pseudarthrobacter sp. ATCC 49987 TaxID=2698204 RepID=UPI003FCDBA45